ncbi:MAG: hypothetical protein ACRCYY_01750 [Trueperaceae bacterium]
MTLEQQTRELADFLASCVTCVEPGQLLAFDEGVLQRLHDLERASQAWPTFRDRYTKLCFDLCAYTLEQSHVLRRVRHKPLGYGSDYLVLDGLYTLKGESFWDAFLIRQPLVQVVQQRHPKLTASSLLVSPIYRALLSLSHHEVYVLEREPEALPFIQSLLPRAHVFETLSGLSQRFQTVYAPYLLQILSAEKVLPTLSLLWQRVETGGVLIVCPLEPQHSLRPFMEWCLDWRLEYHSDTFLSEVARRLGATATLTWQGEWRRLELKKAESF